MAAHAQRIYTTLITLEIITFVVLCQGATAWVQNGALKRKISPDIEFMNTDKALDVYEETAGIDDTFAGHRGPMRIQDDTLAHNIRKVKRAAEGVDDRTRDRKQDKRRRLLQKRYHVFRQRRLGRKKQHDRRDERENMEQVPKSSDKSYQKTISVVPPSNLSKKYDENVHTASRLNVNNIRKRNGNIKPDVVRRPFVKRNPDILDHKKSHYSTKDSSKIINNSHPKKSPDNHNFQDYKSQHAGRLKMLRKRQKYNPKSSQRESESQRNNDFQTDSPSPNLSLAISDETSTSPIASQVRTTQRPPRSQPATVKERYQSEMTTKSPFLAPTQALDYLTSFESLKKPKRWPVRLVLLPTEAVKSPEKSPDIKIDTSLPKKTISVNVKIPSVLSVSETQDSEGKDGQDILTRKDTPTNWKTKKNRKVGTKKDKKKRKRRDKKGDKNSRKRRRQKKRNRHYKKQRHFKTPKDTLSSKTMEPMSTTDMNEVTKPWSIKVVENDLNMNINVFSSITEAPKPYDGSHNLDSGTKNSTVQPFLDPSEMSQLTTEYQMPLTTEDIEYKNHDYGVISAFQFNHSTTQNIDTPKSRENSTDCQDYINCPFNQSSEYNSSATEFTFEQALQNSSYIFENLTNDIKNISFTDNYEFSLLSETNTSAPSHDHTSAADTNNPSAFLQNNANNGITDATVDSITLDTNFKITSKDKSSNFDTSGSEIPVTETSLSSSFSSLSSSEVQSSTTTSTTSPPPISTVLLSSFITPVSSTSSSLPPTPSTTKKVPSSISKWRKWALKRRQRLNKGKKKSGKKSGFKKNNKNDDNKNNKNVNGRGSVAGALVAVSPDNPKTTGAPSTKSPFIGHKTAYDFLSGQQGVHKAHRNEDRRESYDLNRAMAERMCETFDRHFVPTGIGGKCV